MRKRSWAAIAGVLLAGGAIYLVSLPRPTGYAQGTVLETAPQPRPAPARLRIATLNIHGGKGRDGRCDLQRLTNAIAELDADFVALQEVCGPACWEKEGQLSHLARRLDMACLSAPAEYNWLGGGWGNGLLSGLPVDAWQRVPLFRQYDRGYRNAVLVDLRYRGQTVHVLLTHLTQCHDQERREQLRQVAKLFLSLEEPAVLLGDLNSTGEEPEIRRLLDSPGVTDPVGEFLAGHGGGDSTAGRVDWIITRGLRCLRAGVRDSEASDHPLVWADLDLEKGSVLRF